MIFLCINNDVTKKFVYHRVPEDPDSIAALAEMLAIAYRKGMSAQEFAEYASSVLDSPNVEAWWDEHADMEDPWDLAKELRYKRYVRENPDEHE